jgi:hypothetical protein
MANTKGSGVNRLAKGKIGGKTKGENLGNKLAKAMNVSKKKK